MNGPLALARSQRHFLQLRHQATMAVGASIQRQIEPPARPLSALPLPCPRTSFDEQDLALLAEGNLAAVFGAAYAKHGLNSALRLTHRTLRRVELAGSRLMAEASAGHLADTATELLQFFLLYSGVHTLTRDGRFCDVEDSATCDSERRAKHLQFPQSRFEVDVGELLLLPEPQITADFVGIAEGFTMRVADAKRGIIELPPLLVRRTALFDERHIHELTVGSIEACCGSAFATYEGRRGPRLPNGDLQLVSRIVEAHGTRGDFSAPADVVAEYDVPHDAWFGDETGDVPFAILMELGLQPCGFLSFWLGSTFITPERDYRFRNLDGTGTLLRRSDLRGQTIQTRVDLQSSVSMSGMIVQKFSIELSCQGEPLFSGDATCGYFDTDALLRHTGLDGGRPAVPWLAQAGAPATELDVRGQGHLDLLDRLRVVPNGGSFGLGYVYGEHAVSPFDWFYANHFYQDPVMPGSLGVQAMIEALQSIAGRGRQPLNQTTTWKYRGQILPTHDRMAVEVHVKHVDHTPDGRLILADGSVWGNDLRIYEVTNLPLLVSPTGLPG